MAHGWATGSNGLASISNGHSAGDEAGFTTRWPKDPSAGVTVTLLTLPGAAGRDGFGPKGPRNGCTDADGFKNGTTGSVHRPRGDGGGPKKSYSSSRSIDVEGQAIHAYKGSRPLLRRCFRCLDPPCLL